MFNKFLYVFCFFFSSSLAKSQMADCGPFIDFLQQQNNYQTSAGFALRVFITDDACINYKAELGYKAGGGVYIHADASPYFAGQIISKGGKKIKEGIFCLSFLTLLIPEGIGFYPNDNHNLYLAVNPLDIDYWYRKNPYEENSRLCGTIEASYKFPQYKGFPGRISPAIAFNMMYNPADEFKRFSIRIGAALLFDDKPKETVLHVYNY